MWASLSLLIAAQLVACSAQIKAAPQPAPENCKKLPIDADWPSDDVWKTVLRGVEARSPGTKAMRPDYSYEANTVEKVQKAVKFAAEYNLRLSILNSGHDFIGRNDAPSGLALLIGEMKGVRVLESFTPTVEGAESVNYTTKPNTIKPIQGKQAAVTVGGGVNIDELNRGLRASGLYSIGAAHGSVSVAGGWSQAGGHAALSSYFGLGADQILEYKVVTADGQLRVTNSVTNQDLFWALRGGGAGTLGVVVEATLKVYPAPKILAYNFWLNTTDYGDEKSIFPAAAYFCSQLPRLNRLGGFQGYFYIRPNAMSAMFLAPNEYANVTQMTALMDPVLDKMKVMPGIDPKSLIKIPPIDIAAILSGSLQSSSGGRAGGSSTSMSGMNTMMRRHGPMEPAPDTRGILDQDSLLLNEEELNDPRLASALERSQRHGDTGQFRGHLVGGNKVMSSGNDTSVTPAWRSAYVHLMTTGNEEVYAGPLRELSPNGGAYINEGWHKQPDWKRVFWGSNYPRLLSIKQKYDPQVLFYTTPGIGADLLTARNGRLCKADSMVKAAADVRSSTPPDSDNRNRMYYVKEVPSWPLLYTGKGQAPVVWGLGGRFGGAAGVPKVGGAGAGARAGNGSVVPKGV